MVNKVIVQGRLVMDPELRYTQTGTPVASIKIAWSEKYKDQERKLFLPCVVWGNLGEMVSRNFRKGQEAVVEGKLATRQWTNKNGENRSTIELVSDRVHFCGPKRDDGYQGGYQNGSRYDGSDVGYEELNDDGELPF